MKLVAFSDLHAHCHQNHASTLEGGRNSRLQDCLDALRAVYTHAQSVKAAAVLFAGDMFQIKGEVNVDAFNGVWQIIKEEFCDMQTVMIPGNHDMANAEGSLHAIEKFEGGNCRVLGETTRVTGDKLWSSDCLVGIPFQMARGKFAPARFAAKLEAAREMVAHESSKCRILMTHVYTQELMQKYHGLDGDVAAADLMADFDIVLLGHHHIHDVLEDARTRHQVVSIGSPLQLTFNDRGFTRGFVEIDTDTRDVAFHPLAMPRFFKWNSLSELDPAAAKGGFVHIKVADRAEGKHAETRLAAAGCASFTVEILPKASETRLDISGGSKDEEILAKFVASEYGSPDGLNIERLMDKGLGFLEAT